MENFKGLAHIGIYTEDVEATKKFYIDNLGFKLEYETKLDKPNNEWTKLAFMNLNGMILELIQPSDKTKIIKGNDGAVNHLTIEVKDISEAVRELKGKGIAFETEEPIKQGKLFNGAKLIFFKGPNGERLELFEFIK